MRQYSPTLDTLAMLPQREKDELVQHTYNLCKNESIEGRAKHLADEVWGLSLAGAQDLALRVASLLAEFGRYS